jgi:hypothetical protein
MPDGMIRGMGKERRCERCSICGHLAEYPCDKRQTVTVTFKVANVKTLEEAVAELGWKMVKQSTYGQKDDVRFVTPSNGFMGFKINLTTGNVEGAEAMQGYVKTLMQAYQVCNVKAIAKANGFAVHLQQVAGKIVGALTRW